MEHFILSWDLKKSEKYVGNFRDDLIGYLIKSPPPLAIELDWWVESTISFSSNTEMGKGYKSWFEKLNPWFEKRDVNFVLGMLSNFKDKNKPVILGKSDIEQKKTFQSDVKRIKEKD